MEIETDEHVSAKEDSILGLVWTDPRDFTAPVVERITPVEMLQTFMEDMVSDFMDARVEMEPCEWRHCG